MSHVSMISLVSAAIPVLLGACRAPAETDAPAHAPAHPPGDAAAEAQAQASSSRDQAELETQFMLAIAAFDRGAYDQAAELFVQTLLKVPRDPSGDELRHLLVQHIAWSLLGSYDMTKDAAKLDEGEAMLERYLVRHEQLLPLAHGEREDIYALLGEFASRRTGEEPRQVHAELVALTNETARNLLRPDPRPRAANEDAMVREIEVDTIDWAQLDDPDVQRFLRSPRYTGVSVFAEPGDPYNEARVLVRGWVAKPAFVQAGRLAFASLREARPALERCYEHALARGDVNIYERVELGLEWSDGVLDQIEFVDALHFDAASRECLSAALRGAEAEAKGRAASGTARAELQLSFLVQPERWPSLADVNWDYFGVTTPIGGGEIEAGAIPEDASRIPPQR